MLCVMMNMCSYVLRQKLVGNSSYLSKMAVAEVSLMICKLSLKNLALYTRCCTEELKYLRLIKYSYVGLLLISLFEWHTMLCSLRKISAFA